MATAQLPARDWVWSCALVDACKGRDDADRAKYEMRISEVTNIKPQAPMTPEKARIASLQRGVDTAKQALKSERQRQRVQKAQQNLARAKQGG